VNGHWRKGPCGNFIRFTQPKENVIPNEVRVVLVKSFANVKVNLHVEARVSVAACGATASAFASADVKIAVSVLVKAVGSTVNNLLLQIAADVVAKGQVSVTCAVVVPPTTVTPPPECTVKCVPTTPSPHSCSVSPVLGKDGRFVSISVSADSAALSLSTNWGDGPPDSSTGHTYGSDGTWHISVAVHFGDGGSASCGTSITTKLVTQPAPPAQVPGPNPPDDPGPPPNPGNGGTPCPPGWVDDGNGGCNPAGSALLQI
jgi:hypothetical protein